VPIKLIASKIARCAKNVRAYSTLRYVSLTAHHGRAYRVSANTSGYIAGSNRPLPPANKTVSLTCD
jgi:hypothetical protein